MSLTTSDNYCVNFVVNYLWTNIVNDKDYGIVRRGVVNDKVNVIVSKTGLSVSSRVLFVVGDYD